MKRVLIVDDKSDNLYLLRLLFEGHGYAVDEARHGAEALVKARQSPPDLVISDLLMPVMDGFTLLRHWKSDERLKAVPFAVYTATYTEPKDERLALDLGADAFILKPAEPEQLLARLRDLLDRPAADGRADPRAPSGDPDALLEDYGNVLIRKLEEKARQLEQANRALQEDLERRQAAETEANRLRQESERARVALLSILEDQRRAEADLRRERDLFDNLARTIPDHIYFKDRQSRFVRANEAMAHASGRTPAALVGLTDFDLFTEEHARQAYADDQRVMATGEPIVDLEEKETWPDGSVTWVSTTKVPLRDADGRITGLVGVSRDITARRAAEQRLRVSEARFRALFENSLDGFLLTDPVDGRVLEANPAACRLLGRSEDELRRARRGDLVDPADPRVSPLLERRARTGRAEGEFTFIRGDGTRFEAEVASVVFATAEGPRTSMVIRDITERREAERRIREQAMLLDRAAEAIVVIGLDQRVTYWNRGAERLFGRAAGEAVGRVAAEVLHLGAIGVDSPVADGLATDDQWRGELRGFDGDHRPLTVELGISLVRDDAGRPVARLGIGADITEKKHLEEQFMRAQRLESIGMLSAGIAHDLNNVLAPILMSVPLLRDHATDPRDLRLLETVEKSANRGSGLVRQILGFAHGIGGEPRIVQAKHLLRDIVDVIEASFPKSIVLEHFIPSDLWPIKANPTQIHQVLLNLCVNARDAMPEGGRLILRAENRVLDATEAARHDGAHPGPWLVVHVEDSGTGIPPEIVERIWEPFFTTKGAGKGTGLGLSTVRGIVANHRGFVTLDTQAGRGTTFRVYLRADENSLAPPGSAQPFPSQRGQGELILFVDDEQSIRDVATSILTRFGYRVVTAVDGFEAATLFGNRSTEIRLLVTDLAMPNVDGAALVGIVRQINPGMKILAISGAESSNHPAVPAAQLADGFLGKPFTANDLLAAVHTLLHPDAPSAG